MTFLHQNNIPHFERLALSGAIDQPLPRRMRRVRVRVGDAVVAILFAGLIWAALVVFT